MLTIYTEEENEQQAKAVYYASLQSTTKTRYVGMYGFCTCTDPELNLLMATSGAGPCQIIVVHGTNKVGALGHYGGTANPKLILQGVEKMVDKLGLTSSEVASVVFAAGSGVEGEKLKQKTYELAVFGGTLRRYPSATVKWPPQDPGDPWGACVYHPKTEKLALFHSLPGNFLDVPKDAPTGVAMWNYASSNQST